MINLTWLVERLAADDSLFIEDAGYAPAVAQVQLPQMQDPVLLDRLPPLSVLERDASEQAKETYTKACIDAAMDTSLDIPVKESDVRVSAHDRSGSKSDMPPKSGDTSQQDSKSQTTTATMQSATKPRRKIAHWELLRAIEKKDLQLIFETRDNQFELLVSAQGGATPLLYTIRIGKSHKDIAILLVGALSRYVNNLPDDVAPSPQTKNLLRQVRVSLKLAIDYSLAVNQTELISSYLQVIVMSEGDNWIRKSSQDVGLAQRLGKRGRPVATAFGLVQAFATRELRQINKTASVASVEAYVCNACEDLLLMALAGNVFELVGGSALPTYQFARDDRLFKTFSDRMDEASVNRKFEKVQKLARQQIVILREILASRATSHRAKVEALRKAMDEEEPT